MNTMSARERQSADDGSAAKALDQSGFAPPFEPGFGEPGRKLGDFGLGHGSNHKSSGTEGQRATGPLAPDVPAP